jgi:hypothetical protein
MVGFTENDLRVNQRGSITAPQRARLLRGAVIKMVMPLLACGLSGLFLWLVASLDGSISQPWQIVFNCFGIGSIAGLFLGGAMLLDVIHRYRRDSRRTSRQSQRRTDTLH